MKGSNNNSVWAALFALLVAVAAIATTVEAFVTPSSSSSHQHYVEHYVKHAIATLPPRATPSTTSTQLHGFFQDLFQKDKTMATKQSAAVPPPPPVDDVEIAPDFRVAALFLFVGIALDRIPYMQWSLGPVVTLLGLLFLVQTFRIRFRIKNNKFELVETGQDQTGENILVGGDNSWDVSTIVNYDFFPQSWMDSPIGPVLVYFKETQTPSSTWNDGPGASSNDAAKIAAGQAVAGQVHFFPAVASAQQIRAEFEKRKVRKL